MNQLKFSRKNPFRPVDWRWQRAGLIASGELRPSRRRDDTWVMRAVNYRQALEASDNENDIWRVAVTAPDIHWAREIERGIDDDNNQLATYALQARLLAEQPHRDIAKRQSIDSDTVRAYAKLFFDIEGRLQSLDYIAHAVMGPAVYRGLSERQYDLYWKLYAWRFGPMMIDMFLAGFANSARPDTEEALQATIVDTAKASMRVKGMLAAKMVSVSSYTGCPLFTDFMRLVEHEAAGAGHGGTAEGIITNVGAMMRALPFRVGDGDIQGDAAAPTVALGVYDESAAELSGQELLQLGVGEEPVDADKFKQLALPSPHAFSTV